MIRSLAELVIFRIFASIIHIGWLMTVIECTEERYALNLNPYQIFVFINEKTKPYLDLFKELQEKSKPYDIVLLPFDSSEAQEYVDDSIDPQLYNVISHSDIVARVMPKKFGDYRYMTELQATVLSSFTFMITIHTISKSSPLIYITSPKMK